MSNKLNLRRVNANRRARHNKYERELRAALDRHIDDFMRTLVSEAVKVDFVGAMFAPGAFASGGLVQRKEPYRVGERGPERYAPSPATYTFATLPQTPSATEKMFGVRLSDVNAVAIWRNETWDIIRDPSDFITVTDDVGFEHVIHVRGQS